MNHAETNPSNVSDAATHDRAHDGRAARGTGRVESERLIAEAQRLLGRAWEAGTELVRKGNRRRFTLRGRNGETFVRMPLTLAVILALLLVPYWPLLVALVLIGFAVGAQLSVERQADQGSGSQTNASNGAA